MEKRKCNHYYIEKALKYSTINKRFLWFKWKRNNNLLGFHAFCVNCGDYRYIEYKKI